MNPTPAQGLSEARATRVLINAALAWMEIDNLPSPPATAEMLKASDSELFAAVRAYAARVDASDGGTEAGGAGHPALVAAVARLDEIRGICTGTRQPILDHGKCLETAADLKIVLDAVEVDTPRAGLVDIVDDLAGYAKHTRDCARWGLINRDEIQCDCGFEGALVSAFAAAFAAARSAPSPATRPVGDGWRPIESAPKDGRIIDIWVQPKRDSIGHRIADVKWDEGRWALAYSGIAGETVGHPCVAWQPLPAPPHVAQAEGKESRADLRQALDTETASHAQTLQAYFDLTEQVRVLREALDWFSANISLSLEYGYPDEEGARGEWQVHLVAGNINDREWKLIGTGETAFAAIIAARQVFEGGKGR